MYDAATLIPLLNFTHETLVAEIRLTGEIIDGILTTKFIGVPISVYPRAPRVVLRRLQFEGSDDGPAVRVYGSSVHILDSVFMGNRGSAVEVRQFENELPTELEMVNVTFEANGNVERPGGALSVSGGLVAVARSRFVGNRASEGGAMYISGGEVTLENGTYMRNNYAQSSSGALLVNNETRGHGASFLAIGGFVRYLLPANLGHWVGPATSIVPNVTVLPSQLTWRWKPIFDTGIDYDGQLVAPAKIDGTR